MLTAVVLVLAALWVHTRIRAAGGLPRPRLRHAAVLALLAVLITAAVLALRTRADQARDRARRKDR